MVIVVLNVGANTITEWGGFRAIVDNEGRFKFVPIPLKDRFITIPDTLAPTYADLGLEWTVPPEKLKQRALVSPDFKNLAYGHFNRPSDGKIFWKLKEEGGYLFFFSTFKYGPNRNQWGAYLIGYFLTELVLKEEELSRQEDIYLEKLREYSWYKTSDTQNKGRVKADWWIKGSVGGLFLRAVPLSEPENPKRWNSFAIKTLRTTGQAPKTLESDKTAKYNWTLVVEKSAIDYFWSEVSRISLAVECRYV